VFNFLKEPCREDDLWGYVAQGAGGAYNLHLQAGTEFDAYHIARQTYVTIEGRKKKITPEQEARVEAAARAIQRSKVRGELSPMYRSVQRIAEMMRGADADWDWADPAFPTLREQLAQDGVIFNF